MSANESPSRRERILRGHVLKYSLSSARLMASAYFQDTANPQKQATRFLNSLCDDGFLQKRLAMTHEVPDANAPLFKWNGGDPPPKASALKHMADIRWQTTLSPVTVYFATRKAANSFGGRASSPNTMHASHDLFCCAVYLHFEATRPAEAFHWRKEGTFDHLLAKNEKPGDARLIESDRDYLMIEILGRYSLQHIESIHPFCSERQLAYEIW